MVSDESRQQFDDFSVDFDKLPYDVLLNVFLYCSGLRTVASLQRTAKRLHEIGSEEDYIWKLQKERFYPSCHTDENSSNFASYYLALRGFITTSKTNALASLINRLHADFVNPSWRADRMDPAERAVLTNASEISLARGVCMGPDAARIFGQFGAWQLDTLDLSGQRLRADGLELLATACEAENLPFLRHVALRHDKLGLDAKRSGLALKRITHSCRLTLEGLDLTDNCIGGTAEAVSAFLCNGELTLPRRVWFDENYLGTVGAAMVLEHAAAQMKRASVAATAATSAAATLSVRSVPAMLSLRSVGIGFDHTTSVAGDSASRSRTDLVLRLVAAMGSYWTLYLGLAGTLAKHREATRQIREQSVQSGRNKGANTTVLASVERQKMKRQAGGGGAGNGALVVSMLDLSNKTIAAGSPAGSPATKAAAAAATTATAGASPFIKALENALPASLEKEKAVQESQAFVSVGLKYNAETMKKVVNIEVGGARLHVAFPKCDGAEPSSCCIQ